MDRSTRGRAAPICCVTIFLTSLAVFCPLTSFAQCDDPTIVGHVGTPQPAHSVAVAEGEPYDWAYVGVGDAYGFSSTLEVVDVSEPTSPERVGAVVTPSVIQGLSVWGIYAYAGAGDAYGYSAGFHVIDVGEPAAPAIVGSVDLPSQPHGVDLGESHAYVAGGYSGLHVVDVSDPTSPTIAATLLTPGRAQGVAVAGPHAYVADWQAGLQLVDISDPVSPTIVGSVDTPGHAWGVAVSGDYAYVADRNSGLQIVDVSDPASPTIVGGVYTASWARRVKVLRQYVYVSHYYSGISVVDVSDPASPEIVANVDTPGYAFDVAAAGAHAYVADHYRGLQVLSAPCQTVALDIKPGSCPNPLNVEAQGLLPIALIGTAEFDVLEIDPGTILLEGVAPTHDAVEDVATPFTGELCDCHDATSDGFPDLTFKFDTVELVPALGEVWDREDRELVLTGDLLDGTPFEARDCVHILRGLIPPTISVAPAALTQDLFTGASSTQTLTIENSGEADLQWQIAISYESPVGPWLHASPAAGLVPGGGSAEVILTIDAFGLHGGDHLADLVVTSNDPVASQIIVPTTLHVTGAPDIHVTPLAIDFGLTFIGATPTSTVNVSNVGAEPLSVTSVAADHPDYTVDATNLVLSPGEDQDVVVTFAPTSSSVGSRPRARR